MKILNGAGMTPGELTARLKGLDDSELIAQELVQKGALHALETLRARRLPLDQMIESVERYARLISDECRRRGVAVADELEIS
jgi:hypothetical protein